MKFLPSELASVLGEREMRRNLRSLLSYGALLGATVLLFTLLFHVIMLYEGQEHSWLTGFYWTLTVMSTLGFGDITFHSDVGRAFTILVLIFGIVMLLIVLPFYFIRYFYAPWLEAQVRLRAPRKVSDDTRDHVIICQYDEIASGLIARLDKAEIPYYVIEPDPAVAANYHSDGVSVVTGPPDSKATYEALRVADARLVLANLSDAVNTNITLTVRELAPEVPIAALASALDSVDILKLAGASDVLPLKKQLGEQLASRVSVGTPKALRIGRFEDLIIAEFPIHGTKLPGRTVRDTRLREITGLNIVAIWERSQLVPATPDSMLSEHSVPVVIGTEEQLTELEALFSIYLPDDNPVLVIGGGAVGCAAAQALHEREVLVTLLDKDPALEAKLASWADRVVIGDAANLQTVLHAGVEKSPSVLLTTNDDATNIYLAVYCRKLNPKARIICRITHDWNLEAIHRAGAEFVLSHSSLAIKTLISLIQQRELVIVDEGTELFVEGVPRAMAGKSLEESGIGTRTGLNVVALRSAGKLTTNPPAATKLPAEGELVMLGSPDQHREFLRLAK